ncbi:MAG: esterase-like activity of phytase family protein [Methylovulum sp.]|uniref:esterase-like activity of phytase family protein n=1 Tax=Methylovulum sp. TaxID=1916980 RepID=UPI002629312D|nr:esterase-like activity of phytase family protein [Methylovulum sp.]MDD2725446.1 esterase-like activity of phytase family protein [Methylovulum sp.]MDD5124483.1 esterase-like activity of phytase family protein [Methylovulum sp.]
MTKKILPFLIPLLITAPLAQAEVNLIAVGKIDGSYQDLSPRTAPALESGVAGNILGGVGSGLAYAGGNTFIAIPDRGPNATAYNSNVDDTTSYIPRFQTFNLSLAVNPNYDALTVGSMPYILSPELTATTLLSNARPLTYAVNGAPALNTTSKYYYTGRSDNFNPARKSTSPFNGRLDPEGIRVANDGKSVFITDEYGPYVYQFSRTTGRMIKSFKLPDYYAIKNLSAIGKDEISGNTSGRMANKGMEALAISPDGTTLFGMMQQNLIQDTKKYIRIIKIDIATGATVEYAYKLTDGSSVSDLLAINDHEFLVDERDGAGLGDGTSAVVKKLYKIDLTGATDISGKTLDAATIPTVTLVSETATPFLDVLAKLVANGIPATQIPAKLEGVAFGPDLIVNGATKHTLLIANDNDFLPTVGGVANPNQFFVFSFDDIDLPNLTPQTVAPLALDKSDRG